MRHGNRGIPRTARGDGAPRAEVAGLRETLARLAVASLARRRWRRPEEPVEPRVRRVVAQRLGVSPEELMPETSLTDDLAADSLDLVDLALAVEEELGVSVPESLIDDIRTYRELVDAAQALTRRKRAAEARQEAKRVPPFVWVRILPPPASARGDLERAGWLTPYTAETIVESALRAGPGARVDVGVSPNLSEPSMTLLEHDLGRLGSRGIEVRIRRDPYLPPIGAVA